MYFLFVNCMDYQLTHIEDQEDSRDHLLEINIVNEQPDSFNLRELNFLPDVLDQGSLNTCVVCVLGTILQFNLKKINHLDNFIPSRLFLYYFGRIIDNDPVDKDTGITIRSGLKALEKFYTVDESIYPYIVENFSIKPSDIHINNALKIKKQIKYVRVQKTMINIKAVLKITPIAIGLMIYESFKKIRGDGIVSLPKETETCIGSHAMVLVSYDDNTRLFGLMNSWGRKTFGDSGFCYAPYDYILDDKLSFKNFWTFYFI